MRAKIRIFLTKQKVLYKKIYKTPVFLTYMKMYFEYTSGSENNTATQPFCHIVSRYLRMLTF